MGQQHPPEFVAGLASIALLATVTMAGCSNDAATPNAAAGPSSSTSAATTGPSAGSRAAASYDPVQAAETAFTTWARPSLDYATWWSDLQPLLSPAGQQAYAGTDPANIPVLTTTSPYTLDPVAPDDPDTTALVRVETDLGPFALFMAHQAPGQPWYLLQIQFPPGIH